MSHVLFLTQRMVAGYGVDVVIHNVTRELHALGHEVTVAAVDRDGSFDDIRVHAVARDHALGEEQDVAHVPLDRR